MKLYSHNLSPYAARVRGVIYTKDLPIEIVAPPEDFRTNKAYLALSPMGKIPVLVLDDGTGLPESAVIAEYLEETFPTPPLHPKSAAAKAKGRVLCEFATLYVIGAGMPLFNLLGANPRDEHAIASHLTSLHRGLAALDVLLPKGAYAVGNGLTSADLWLGPVRFLLDTLKAQVGVPTLLDKYPAVDAYADVARRDPILRRLWNELDAALTAYVTGKGIQ